MRWNLSVVEIFSVVRILSCKGWRLPVPGRTIVNGTLAADLMKDQQLLMLSQNLAPDQQWIEQQCPQGTATASHP